MGTTIPSLSQDDWAASWCDDLPDGWFDIEETQPGGSVYVPAFAAAAGLKVINDLLTYAFNASRIQTATDTELDLASQDFYGFEKPRNPGESDASFRIRILAGLLLEKVTRNGIIMVITQLTGIKPRLIEPWNVNDTAAYDWRCYYDVDLPDIPGNYGDTGLHYTIGIITQLPNTTPEGATAIWGYDKGAAYDSFTGVFWQSLSAEFINLNDLYKAVTSAKAAGIAAFLRLTPTGQSNSILATSYKVANGTINGNPTVQAVTTPFCVLLSGSWNSNYWTYGFTSTRYSFGVSSPASSVSKTLNSAVLPFTVPGSGSIGMPAGRPTATINGPIGSVPPLLCVTPSWNTTVWIDSFTSTSVTLAFSVLPRVGDSCSTYWPTVDRGSQEVEPGSTSAGIVMTRDGVPFVLPNWNTTCAITQSGANLSVSFSTPAPVGAYLAWAAL